MFRLLISFILLLLAGYGTAPALAQAQAPATEPPLFRFFQQHFDSTVVYQTSSSWYEAPDMLLLAKKGQTVYFFTYRSPYTSTGGRFVPGGLTRFFSEQEARFRITKPDTNHYLLLSEVSSVKLAQTWQALRITQLWKVRDADPQPAGQICGVEDAETVTLHFITPSGTRAAPFYAPDFYEECEGPGLNRGQVIRTRNALQALLKL